MQMRYTTYKTKLFCKDVMGRSWAYLLQLYPLYGSENKWEIYIPLFGPSENHDQPDGWNMMDGTWWNHVIGLQKCTEKPRFCVFIFPCNCLVVLPCCFTMWLHVFLLTNGRRLPERSFDPLVRWPEKDVTPGGKKTRLFPATNKKGGRIFIRCNIINSHFWSRGARVRGVGWNFYDGQFKFIFVLGMFRSTVPLSTDCNCPVGFWVFTRRTCTVSHSP